MKWNELRIEFVCDDQTEKWNYSDSHLFRHFNLNAKLLLFAIIQAILFFLPNLMKKWKENRTYENNRFICLMILYSYRKKKITKKNQERGNNSGKSKKQKLIDETDLYLNKIV